jgi:hypothetical protein
MLTTEKRNSQILAYWFAMMLVFIIIGGYGSDAIAWIITKLYEFFIMRKPVSWF